MFGDPRLPPRFWSKVAVQDSGCWEWVASLKSGGYGSFRSGQRAKYAHRVAYEALVGNVPDGLDLDHLCRVRHCVNPAHLEPVTRAVNCQRSPIMGQHGRTITTCPSGHAYDAANTYRDRTGHRFCRACLRAKMAAFRAQNRERLRVEAVAYRDRRRAA